ncbi:DUF6518 family protein [Streptomyces sp. NPDC002577]
MASSKGWVYATAGALGAGLVLGTLTNLAQGRLPDAWQSLANSGAVWSTVAFVAGALIAARASLWTVGVAGLCAEVGLVVGYYGYAEFGVDREGMGDLTFPLIWLAMACIAGPLFGVAAAWWRRGRTTWRRVSGPAALAGVFGMEGIQYARVLHYIPPAWACLAVALLVSLLMPRSHKERALTLATAAALSLLAYAVIEIPLSGISA